MIKIGVFGHSPDSFPDVRSIVRTIDNVVASLKRQYGPDNEFNFLLSCEPGVSQWFCNILMENNLPYEIYLTSTTDTTSEHWSEEQQQALLVQTAKARATHAFDVNCSYENRIKRNRSVVDQSQWVLVFWNGKHQGLTYEAMKYAIETNKLVFNAMNDDLKLLDGKVLNNINERLQWS